MNTKVIHNVELKRHEIWLDDAKVGHSDYSVRPGEIHLVHTEVDPEQRGKNLAGIMVEQQLADIRENFDEKVVPVCSYVVKFFETHPEVQDLLLNPIDQAAAACQIKPKSD
jgi:predicted GNAT family acetyltransferase